DRHEQVADRVLAGLRQREAERLALLGEERVRNLNEDSGAVAHAGVGAHRAAMLEVAEDLQRVLDDLMRLAAFDVGDETDAAGILVERGVVQTLCGRNARIGGVAEGFHVHDGPTLYHPRPVCRIAAYQPHSAALMKAAAAEKS